MWEGGKFLDGNGYVLRNKSAFTGAELLILQPMLGKSRTILEHRAVKALELGRPLQRIEVVHHKNNIRNDNRSENLEIWIKGHNAGFSSNVSMRCPCCGHRDKALGFLS